MELVDELVDGGDVGVAVPDDLEVYFSVCAGGERPPGGAGDGLAPDDRGNDGPAVTSGDVL